MAVLAVLCCGAALALGADPYQRQWTVLAGVAANDGARRVACDSQGNVLVTGFSAGDFGGNKNASPGHTDILLAKYASSGALLWSRLYGESNDDGGCGLAVDAADNIYVLGRVYDTFVLLKYDRNGTLQWRKDIGSTWHLETDGAIAADAGGMVTFAGRVGAQLAVARYDPQGNPVWTQTYGNAWGYDIALSSASEIVIAGSAYGTIDGYAPQGGEDIYLLKCSSAGVRQWSALLGGSGYEGGRGVALDAQGSIYLTGYTTERLFGSAPASLNDDLVLVKCDPAGTYLWQKQFDLKGYDDAAGVAVGSDGDVFLCGSQDSRREIILRVSPDGDIRWSQSHETGAGATGIAVFGTALYTAGTTRDSFDGRANHGGTDLFLTAWGPAAGQSQAETTGKGTVTVVGSSQSRGTIQPDKGDTALIYFTGTQPGTYTCRIFTMAHELVFEETQTNVQQGVFQWVPRDVASGIYIAHIEGPGLSVRKKIAILR